MCTTSRFAPSPATTAWPTLPTPRTGGPGNRILKNYLSFSFSRAVFLIERDVDQTAPSNLPLVFDDDRCLFNTGLYTRRYETIYGLFEPNTKPDARQRWFLTTDCPSAPTSTTFWATRRTLRASPPA